MKVLKKKIGFTLIEVLISVVIFSFAMIVSAGIFSNIIGSEGSIIANFSVNKESARLIRQISDDIISANGRGKVEKRGGVILAEANLVRGVLFLDNNKKIIYPTSACITTSDVAGCNFSGIVLFSSKDTKIYFVDETKKTLNYSVSPSTTLKINNLGGVCDSSCGADAYKFTSVLDNKVEIANAKFSGIGCYSSATVCSNMPFVKTNLTFATRNFDSKAPSRRAKINLITSVTLRNY